MRRLALILGTLCSLRSFPQGQAIVCYRNPCNKESRPASSHMSEFWKWIGPLFASPTPLAYLSPQMRLLFWPGVELACLLMTHLKPEVPRQVATLFLTHQNFLKESISSKFFLLFKPWTGVLLPQVPRPSCRDDLGLCLSPYFCPSLLFQRMESKLQGFPVVPGFWPHLPALGPWKESESVSRSVMSNSLWPHGL